MLHRNVFSALAFAARATRGFFGSGRSAARSKAETAQWTPELLKRLEWRRFEELCVAYFEELGFRTDLAYSGDGINLYAGGSESASIIVQCKPWNAYRVGINPVRGLRGAMASENVVEGVLVTAGKFTQEARDFAGKEKISLIDGAELLGKIAALLPEKALALLKVATQGDFLTPTCPSCAIKMISRKSTKHGRKFWGCRNYPRCKHTFSDTV
jgi:restriction system protein